LRLPSLDPQLGYVLYLMLAVPPAVVYRIVESLTPALEVGDIMKILAG
jgi:hypothetical protein